MNKLIIIIGCSVLALILGLLLPTLDISTILMEKVPISTPKKPFEVILKGFQIIAILIITFSKKTRHVDKPISC